jgi:hypothetical protein
MKHYLELPIGLLAACVFFAAGPLQAGVANGVPFVELQKQIDALAAEVAELSLRSGPLEVLANGERIGLLVDMGLELDEYGYTYMTRNASGYTFIVYADIAESDLPSGVENGDLVSQPFVAFSAPDCLGQAYYMPADIGRGLALWPDTSFEEGVYKVVLVQDGLVFRNPDSSAAVQNYYIPRGTEIVDQPLISSAFGEGAGCAPFTLSFKGVPLLPNDPAITGVPNTPFVSPIVLGP